jgi:hypothetical protein
MNKISILTAGRTVTNIKYDSMWSEVGFPERMAN